MSEEELELLEYVFSLAIGEAYSEEIDKISLLQKKIICISKENQELKKQLENCYCNRIDCAGRIKDSKLYDSLVQKIENQQKEFIEWLKNESAELIRDSGYHRRICLDILEKYKEIIGKDINAHSKGDNNDNE